MHLIRFSNGKIEQSIISRCIFFVALGGLWFCAYIQLLILLNGACANYFKYKLDLFTLNVPDAIILIFNGVIISPLLEEFIFRKLIIGVFLKNYLPLGVIISSFLFSFIHGVYYPVGLVNYHYVIIFLTGLLLGIVYVTYNRKIINTIFLHSVINSFMLIQDNVLALINKTFCQ